MNNKSGKTFLLTFVGLAVLCGCTRDQTGDIDIGADILEMTPRLKEVKLGSPKKINQMDMDDVIVAINGVPLRRREFDDRMAITVRLLQRRGQLNNSILTMERIEQEKANLLTSFVTSRLLIDNARELGILSTNKVSELVSVYLKETAKEQKKTVQQVIEAYPGDKKYLYYDVAARFLIDALIAKKIPPKIIVNEAFVSNVQAQVTADNLAIQKTNAMLKARLVEMKKEIVSGRESFADMANRYSQDADDGAGKDGAWGVFERGEMSDKKVQAVAFALAEGEVSDPVEDENGYHLITVTDIVPQQRNEKGRVIQKEIRSLSHIFLEKEPEILRQDDPAMWKDLQSQMQHQAISDYATNLATNGQNKIIWPHGHNLL